MSPFPDERKRTLRETIRESLESSHLTAGELSRLIGVSEKEVYEHLPHVRKSLGRKRSIVVKPAQCLACGFQFKKRDRCTPPGRCPVCRSGRISESVFGIDD
jgi:predicted Zn-ribbon and HTH transcriptional regulator